MNSTRVISPKNSTMLISPPDCSDSDKSSHLARIEVFVCLVFVLSLVQFPMGFVRRRYNSGVLKAIGLGINAAITLMIPYIFGLLGSSELKHARITVWIILLLYVYCNTPSSLKLNDPMGVAVAVLKPTLYTYYVFVLLVTHNDRPITDLGIMLIVLDSIMKAPDVGDISLAISPHTLVRARKASIRESQEVDEAPPQTAMPTDSIRDGQEVDDAPPQTAMPTDSIRDGQEVDEAPPPTAMPTDSNDPWIRCEYVAFYVPLPTRLLNLLLHKTAPPDITIQRIWRSCEEAGCILNSYSDLKSYCLSFSLFRKLHLRFAGRFSNQSSQQEEQWNLVRDGLLLNSSSICPFRVVELELALAHDRLHSNIRSVYGFALELTLARHLAVLVGICLLAVPALEKHHPKEEVLPGFQIQCYGHGRELVITRIVIIGSIMLESLQLLVSLRPRYSKMRLLRTYLSQESWKRENVWDRCIHKATEIILRPTNGASELSKPWQRQLGQYSLLDPCSYRQLIKKVLTTIPDPVIGGLFARLCRKQSENAPLTDEIKDAVIQALLARGPQLTNGIATLQDNNNQLPRETKRKLAWACTRINTDVEVVLIWHIATSFCKLNPNPLALDAHGNCNDDVCVATSLSNYCAYLVAFAPDMLPGHVASTQHVCSRTIVMAYKCLMNCTQEQDIYEKFMKLAVKDDVDIEFHDPNTQIDDTSIVQKGAGLGKLLVNEIGDPRIRWKLLATFWAEMILYLAPNAHNDWEHLERLADGGEFITHLWALLFHAGIVDRDSLNKARDVEAQSLELHQV